MLRARDERPHGLDGLEDGDVARIFGQMQAARDKRIRHLVEDAHENQALMASERPLKTRLVAWAMAVLPSAHWTLHNVSANVVGASRITSLPVPRRPRAVPFEDERPAPPVKPMAAGVVRHGYAGAVLAAAVWAARAAPPPGATAAGMASLWRHAAPLLMYTIEGHRVGHRGSLLGVPSAVAVGLHGLGLDRVIPSYALLHALFAFDDPPDRHVPLPAAKSILQAFALSGFASAAKHWLDRCQGVPSDPATAVKSFSLLFPVLAWGLSKLRSRANKSGRSKGQDDVGTHLPFDQYQTRDLAYLRGVYMCAFGIQAAAHVASGAPLCFSQGLLRACKAAVENPSAILGSLQSLLSGESLTYAVWVLQNFYAVWHLRKLGYVKTWRALKAAAGVALGQVLVGPGATWAAVWWWREEVFATSMIE